MPKNYFGLIFLLVLAPAWLCAEDTERKNDAWIGDFFKHGIQSAFAEFTIKVPSPREISPNYYERMSYSVEYNDYTKTYALRFSYEHRDDWNILTDNGNHPPVQKQPYFIGSKISQWTNTNGLGIYSEVYQRTVPNWMVFEDLDSMLMMHSKLGNPLPPLTGIFHTDELKAIKKIYKEAGDEELLRCFEFDQAGNLVELSRAYLDEFNESSFGAKKPIEDYSIVVRNMADDVVFIKPILHASSFQIIEGISLKYGDKRARIFSFELNGMLNKFIPQIISDPQDLINKYVLELQKKCDKEFIRFQTTAEK